MIADTQNTHQHSSEEEYQTLIPNLAKQCNKGCGLSFELYLSRFEYAIDELLDRAPTADRDIIISIAKQHDYSTREERKQAELDELDSDACVHGFGPNCCPLGCDDREDDSEEIHAEPKGYNEAPNVELIVDALLDELREKAIICPISWSFLKLYTISNPELVEWYSTFYIHDKDNIRTPRELFHYLKRQLLDERFSLWLNRRIEEAKHS